jgi:hypothetical protein
MREMDSFAVGGFVVSESRPIPVEVYTADYHLTGQLRTRLSRVAEILNQLGSTHLAVEQVTITEYGDTVQQQAPHVFVPLGEILLMVAGGTEAHTRDEMRIPKRPIKVELALPPFRVRGTMYVALGSNVADGLLMGSDRFLPVTDATITSLPHPELARQVPALAIERDRAQLIVVEEDDEPQELLAEVLDERTAAAWLRPDTTPGAA